MMTVAELMEIQAFWNLQPWGSKVDDLRAARICATTANFSSAVDWKKRGKKPFLPSDFLPEYERPKKTTTKEKLAQVKLINLAHGGTDKTHGRTRNKKH
jgi:hypothetical protein